ncbi:GNAT family N-acetyltransferase [Vibrio sp. SCSIO 43135]|uniref:GNAT family N-acetyltransferase n=1 Tax=Vibrio paucivorans TaxID=2829489 RepID=A0A9X3CGY8_9VIBR|nr:MULTISPECIES: GNAT family N-acetyltransferase [Vibrio]MCW8335617.1 GNAT family N-acetyltransferase [Vibrio paucivorans]USD42439.1 GNAT family N-acetyltransferase [Vibrio sp. SCSIO 43135]
MSTIAITAAQAKDLETLNELMFDLHNEHHLACPEHFKTAEEIEQEKSIARYLDDPECLVLIAKVDNRVIGFITGHFCELVSTVSKPIPMGSIDELYVAPKYRQHKVAHRLCRQLEQRFKEYGVQQVFVEVWNFNQVAIDFYKHSGFEHHIHWLRKAL